MFAVLTVVVTVSLYSQNPPAPPPQPTPAPAPPPAAPDTSRRARARTELPRPQKPITTNATVITGEGITLDSTLLAGFRWRAIGPANVGGRVSSVTGIPSPSKTFFVAAAAGGIWKTTNAGTTFRPVFDNEKCVSMGELAIAPSDTTQVWAGTGEEDSRNTISPGCGIFKSTDGGLTWKLVGLEKTGAIGRRVVEDDGRRQDVDRSARRWTARDHQGPHRHRDRRVRPEDDLPDVGSRHDGKSASHRRQGRTDQALRSLSLDRRRREVGEDERQRRPALLLLAGTRRSEGCQSRLLVIDAGQFLQRRRQNDRQRDRRHSRRPSLDVDRPERSQSHRRRERRRRGADLGQGRQLGLPQHVPDRPALHRQLRHGVSVQRLRRLPGQRLVVRAIAAASGRAHERRLDDWRRRRRLLYGPGY